MLAVVGDSESFVPRPWNATAFTADLINTLKKVEGISMLCHLYTTRCEVKNES